MRKAILVAAALAAPFPAWADGGAEWQESPQYFRANETPDGEHSHVEGDVIASIPLRWLVAARLGSDVSFVVNDEEVAMAEGQTLPLLMFMPDGTRASAQLAFCTPRRRGENATRSGLGGALFGGSLWDSLAKDLTDTQFCLRDSDGDDLLDTTFLVGEGELDYVLGPDIEPLPMEVAEDAEISEEDMVRIRLHSVGRNRLEFGLELIQQGHNIDFTSVSALGASGHSLTSVDVRDGYPEMTEIFGMRFQITAHDRKANTASLRWFGGEQERPVMVPEGYRRTITYGY